MFDRELNLILKDCSYHHRDKNSLLKSMINKRLNQSLETYYHELELSANYLMNRKSENVINKF